MAFLGKLAHRTSPSPSPPPPPPQLLPQPQPQPQPRLLVVFPPPSPQLPLPPCLPALPTLPFLPAGWCSGDVACDAASASHVKVSTTESGLEKVGLELSLILPSVALSWWQRKYHDSPPPPRRYLSHFSVLIQNSANQTYFSDLEANLGNFSYLGKQRLTDLRMDIRNALLLRMEVISLCPNSSMAASASRSVRSRKNTRHLIGRFVETKNKTKKSSLSTERWDVRCSVRATAEAAAAVAAARAR